MSHEAHYQWVSDLSRTAQTAYNCSKLSDLTVHTHGRIVAVNSLVIASQSDLLKDVVLGGCLHQPF